MSFRIYSDPVNVEVNVDFSVQTSEELENKNAVIGKVLLGDSTSTDAFYRLRTSNPVTLFEGKTIYDSAPFLYDNDIVGSAVITGPTGGYMLMTLNSNSIINDYASRQSHFYAQYQPGKSFLAMFTFRFYPAVSGIIRRVGLYDIDNSNNNLPQNGILLEQTISGLSWKVYQGPPGNTIQVSARDNWTVDKFDGTGPSEITLNETANLLGFIDMEWLGTGRVRCGFFINGVPLVATVFNNTSFTEPYINNPYLPIRYEVRKSSSNSSSANMEVICATIISEGGFTPLGIVRSFRSQQLSLDGVEVESCIAFRLKETHPRASMRSESLEVVSNLGGNSTAYFSLYLWRPSSSSVPSEIVWSSIDNSIVEYTSTNLYTQMTGDTGLYIKLFEGSISSVSKIAFSDLPDTLLSLQSSYVRANRDIFVVVVDNNNAGNAKTYTAIFTWREFG